MFSATQRRGCGIAGFVAIRNEKKKHNILLDGGKWKTVKVKNDV